MYDRLRARLDAGREDDGFTLVELLIVVVILGVLAGIVVFAVGGVTDRGEAAACEADRKSIQVAQEAHFAQTRSYSNGFGGLVPRFLAEPSTKHATATTTTGYSVTPVAGSGC